MGQYESDRIVIETSDLLTQVEDLAASDLHTSACLLARSTGVHPRARGITLVSDPPARATGTPSPQTMNFTTRSPLLFGSCSRRWSSLLGSQISKVPIYYNRTNPSFLGVYTPYLHCKPGNANSAASADYDQPAVQRATNMVSNLPTSGETCHRDSPTNKGAHFPAGIP